jgi:HPt (histidine-containing phosphotransfer) domain-containing protein
VQDLTMQQLSAASSIPQCWSASPMLEELGDPDLVRQLVGMFLTDCPRRVEEIRAAIESGDNEEIRKAAHAFKGAIGNFTLEEPTTTAGEIEQHGQFGRLHEAAAALERMEPLVASLLSSMHAFLGDTPCGS